MPDDVPEPEVEWPDEDPPAEAETAHDDIMKRLLDYQRSLREGASPEEAAEAMKRGIGDPSLLEVSSAAESLAELLSTEVAPDEIPEPTLEAEPMVEAEPMIEAETAPEIEAPEEPEIEVAAEPEVQVAVEALEPAVESSPEAVPMEAPEEMVEPEPGPAAESPAAEDDLMVATGSRSVLEARVGSLEGKLDDLVAKIAELRRNFQDMAIAADERLATMAEEVEQARREREKE